MLKRFFYLFIAFSVIHGSISSSYAMMNMTGEVWDYDNSTHVPMATYSCPRCNECETDTFATYGYPAILTAGGWIGAWVYTKGADYFWERTPAFVRDRMWPRIRDGFRDVGERAGNVRRTIGQTIDGWRERINAWRMGQQMER